MNSEPAVILIPPTPIPSAPLPSIEGLARDIENFGNSDLGRG